ncbi:MAG: phosphoenolpyruvate carboxylase [Dehalococcoidia bacterium]
MDRHSIHFPSKHAALRDDVHALGGLVGEVLRDQGGSALFELVEGDRVEAINWRAGDTASHQGLIVRTAGRTPAVARDLVRAFSTWFQVVNLAEKVHRLRRRRQYLNDSERPQPGGIGDAIMRLKVDGHSLDGVLGLLRGLTLYPTFTTHPTEIARRTILRKQQHIAELMIERLNPALTPDEKHSVWERIRMELTSGWQTEQHPRERLTVADEREHVLFYLTEIIYRIIPAFYEEIEQALQHAYDVKVDTLQMPVVLRFGSWVGADMDGNPDLHAKSIRETIHRQQQVIISTYYTECLALAERLSQSATRVGVSKRLESRIEEYLRLLPGTQSIAPARHDRMPYRLFLGQIAERLRTTYDGRPNHYEHVGQFEADVMLVIESLRDHNGKFAGLYQVERLLRRIRTFGFHLATLDVRQHADVHRAVIGEGMADQEWSARPAEERAARISTALSGDIGHAAPLGPVGRRTLAVFEAMQQCRHRFGRQSIGSYIVCGTRGHDDVLSVLLLARWADVTDKKSGHVPIDVVPLFDTVEALQQSANVLKALTDNEQYASHLASRGRNQTVLIGYSDSNKGNGIAAARFALYRAQGELVDVARGASVDLVLFHGRGGTTSRGGGRIDALVRSTPPGAIASRLRVTEQGDVVSNNYGLPAIALRTFGQAFHSVMLATAGTMRQGPEKSRYLRVMETIAAASDRRYRELLADDRRFHDFFRQVTPIDVIERMHVGARPAYRPGRADLGGLRAVPWVFSWTQSRHFLPGWFGFGSGLEAAAREHGSSVLAEMRGGWPFFATLLDDVESQLAKADFVIASLYEELVSPEHRDYIETIRQEYALTTRWVLWIKGEVDLLDSDPNLQRAIVLRSPYIDPMHFMQIDLLKRWRAGGREDRDLLEGLLASISGIAQGLQSTG